MSAVDFCGQTEDPRAAAVAVAVAKRSSGARLGGVAAVDSAAAVAAVAVAVGQHCTKGGHPR